MAVAPAACARTASSGALREASSQNLPSGRRLAHQGGAGGLAGDFLRRATEVEIDDLGAGSRGQTNALFYQASFAPNELDDHQRQALANRGAADDIGPAARELGAGDHLGGDVGRSQAARGKTKRQIGDARHWRDPDLRRNINRSDLELVAHFVHTPLALFLGKLCGAVKLFSAAILRRHSGQERATP